MSCRSCGFENMKKSRVCARCGAKLIADRPARLREVTPTLRKNGGFGRFIGRLALRLRPFRKRMASVLSFPSFGVFRRIPQENLRRGLASVVPGLGIRMAGETEHAVKVFACWAAVLALTAAGVRQEFYFATYGVGGAALIHAYAVTAAMRPREFCRTVWEARLFGLAVSAAVLAVYTVAAYGIFRNMEFLVAWRRR